MEFLHSGFTLEISEGGFPLSTDSIALGDFVKLPKEAKVLDLGSGCGTLGMLLLGKRSSCTVTGVEISREDHEMALQNIGRNQLSPHLASICADLKTIPSLFPSGSFSVCVSNPPYFPDGPRSQAYALARHTDACTLEDMIQSAGWALRYGGDFYLVHKPEYLGQIIGLAVKNKLEPKQLRLVRHKENGPVSLILLQCRKGAKPGMLWEECSLYTPDGQQTDYYRQLYHL